MNSRCKADMSMKIGIDASNLLRGGGRTHLLELLKVAEPSRDSFEKIFIWGSEDTLNLLDDKDWLIKFTIPNFRMGYVGRLFWQRYRLPKEAESVGCEVLFVPGGNTGLAFQPTVTMSRNMLPFEWKELFRYGFSFFTLKLILLRFFQIRSFRSADGIIFLTEYAKRAVLNVTGAVKGKICVIPHGLNSRFLSLPKENCSNSNNSINLLYVSIIDQYKHQWNVVEAVAQARAISGMISD